MARRKKQPYHPARDLFGEVPVTRDEVVLWVETVAGISADSWRFEWYCRCWNVPEKIRAAKLAGNWPPEIEKGRQYRPYPPGREIFTSRAF